MFTQLTLDLQLKESFTFDNFISGENHLLITLLKNILSTDEKQLYIWGGHNAGKSHLLQALCHYLAKGKVNVSYLPLEQMLAYSPEVFQGLEALDVCCIDNVDCLQGKMDWQEALFDLINRMREHNKRLILTAKQPATDIQLVLKDLISRLQWGPVFRLLDMSDLEKCQALQQRAEARGFELEDKVANFLLNNFNRDLADLFNMLEALDRAQLQQHRRLTIPFVKQVLAQTVKR